MQLFMVAHQPDLILTKQKRQKNFVTDN